MPPLRLRSPRGHLRRSADGADRRTRYGLALQRIPRVGSGAGTGAGVSEDVSASIHRTLMTGYENAIRSSAENIELVHGHQLDSRLDVVRTVVTIAAPVFAGTITFLDKVSWADSVVQCCLLVGSWILLAVSIAAGLYVFLQSVTLRAFHPKAFNNQIFVGRKFSAVDLQAPDVANQSAQILREATEGLFNSIGVADTRANTATRVCLITFFGSMVAFLVYAIARL